MSKKTQVVSKKSTVLRFVPSIKWEFTYVNDHFFCKRYEKNEISLQPLSTTEGEYIKLGFETTGFETKKYPKSDGSFLTDLIFIAQKSS